MLQHRFRNAARGNAVKFVYRPMRLFLRIRARARRRVILCDIKRAAFVRVCSFLMKTFSPRTNNRARFPRKSSLAATDAIPRIDLFTTFTIKKRNSRRRPSSESISSSEILFCSSPATRTVLRDFILISALSRRRPTRMRMRARGKSDKR